LFRCIIIHFVKMRGLIVATCSALLGVSSALSVRQVTNASQALNLTVASSGGNATSGLQYGVMFEDINRSGDGKERARS